MSDPHHVLLELPQVVLEEKCWLNLKKNSRLICSTLGIGHLGEFGVYEQFYMQLMYIIGVSI